MADIIERTGNATRKQQTVTPPKRYHVVFLNDNVTMVDFVTEVLGTVFHMSEEQASNLIFQIHLSESGVAGTYTFEVAEQKQYEALDRARKEGFPLQIILDEADT